MSLCTVIGHAYINEFFYSDGKRCERISYELPGGAALLAKLLNGRDLTERDKATLYRSYFECEKRTRNDGSSVIIPSKSVGIRKGTFEIPYDESEFAVVWDNGFELNENGESTLAVNEGKKTLWASRKVIPTVEQVEKIAFVILDAHLLRRYGAMISEGSSWERAAMNLIWQLQNHPALIHLNGIPHILITFAEDGAVYIKQVPKEDGKPPIRATLVLNDGRSEGSLRSATGGPYGVEFISMVAAAAQQFGAVMNGADFCVRPVLDSVKAFMNEGYSVDTFAACAFPAKGTNECAEDTGFDIPLQSDGSTQNPDTWQIANLGTVEEMRQTAVDYILHGDAHIKGNPILEIGALKTVDRREIESFSTIFDMITIYAKNEVQQPLSIAVFGSPGSGKSFGVKAIAKSVLSKDEMETVTFNVSQFTDYAELGVAFQKVRDIVLSGKLPLVFFDEFDSAGLDGRSLGWLKYYLAPMQDGEFNDANGTHPIGKCIMVFAGGTAGTFQAFQTPTDPDEFKQKKGPDFVSRIKGSVDIAGPNPRKDEDNSGIADNAYILRRALLIRSLCERDKRLRAAVKSGKDYISTDIINALLLVRSFHHGARSIETILGMSKITDGQWLPSGLPNGEQLGIHVSVREFTDALLLKVIENAPEGRMAKEIHRLFVSHLRDDDRGGITDVTWDDLPPHFKLSNISQARCYPEYVAHYGGRIDVAGLSDEPLDLGENKSDDLAKEEHDRWMAEKIADGWKYGKVKDGKRKTHPCLLPWDELDDYTKDKDRNPIREIPQVLAVVGRCAYKAYS
jgi:hypothetical protein